jgi:hypothetical protein
MLPMTRYKDIDGDSGVAAYEVGADYIRVQFSTGHIYRWTYASAGRQHVEQMKLLAARGDGLNAYINRFVRRKYALRER